MTITLVVAMDDERGIGKDNQLPWHIAEDLHHFKKTTEGKSVVMGMNTFNSLPFKPLPNRKSVILTRERFIY